MEIYLQNLDKSPNLTTQNQTVTVLLIGSTFEQGILAFQ